MSDQTLLGKKNDLAMFSERVQKKLICPTCHASLACCDEAWCCTNPACGIVYPVVQGIPILINENNSLFSIQNYLSELNLSSNHLNCFSQMNSFLPSISKNFKTKENYHHFIERLLNASSHPLVLIVGGKNKGKGMDLFDSFPDIEMVSSDIAFGPCTRIISDAHDIPFEDLTFDGVIVQAVLEHLCDPQRSVDEIYRVLQPEGLVYAETPFMQQVHEGAYDFTRFTHLGHRRLFRHFSEIDSGIVCGPGMAYAWAYKYFLMSFFQFGTIQRIVSLWARLTGFFWKYFDAYLISRPGAYDGASGFYFLGQKSDRILPDRELIKLYRGKIHSQGY